MATVGRLAGAILAETDGSFFLVGNPKEPCDFPSVGFEPPGEIDALKRPFIRLLSCRKVNIAPPCLTLSVEDEALPKLLGDRFLIHRNGSVSDRLWRLVTCPEGEGEQSKAETINADWLAQMPSAVWQIIRDTVLRCT